MRGNCDLKKILAFLLTICFSLGSALPAAAVEQDRIDLMNEAELTVVSPGSADLDEYLDALMMEIFYDLAPEDEEDPDWFVANLTTYEKAEACYDYLIENVSYGSHVANLGTAIGNTTCRAIDRIYGSVEGYGAVALTAEVGMCNAYASAFILMARKIGLKASLAKGYTRRRGGGWAYHEWAEITIGETVYAFDPQLDQSLSKQGLGEDIIFFKTYGEIPGRYSKA